MSDGPAQGLTPIAAGLPAPDFTLRDQNNEQVSLGDFAGRKALLVVFYPLAFTGICTGELGEINKHLNVFATDHTQVVSISCDSSYSQKIFSMRDELNFPLLSDFWPHGEVATRYGVFNQQVGVANRGTFLIDKRGVIRFSECNEIGRGRDAQRWLDEVHKLTAAADPSG